MLATLEVSNLSPKVKPSGIWQWSNILSILVTLEVSNLSPKVKPSGNAQPENIFSISVTLEVSNLSPREKPLWNIQFSNIRSILATLEVSKSLNLKPFSNLESQNRYSQFSGKFLTVKVQSLLKIASANILFLKSSANKSSLLFTVKISLPSITMSPLNTLLPSTNSIPIYNISFIHAKTNAFMFISLFTRRPFL